MPRASALQWLENQRSAAGCWGYLPGASCAGEPTVLACAAGLRPPLDWLETADLGFAWMLLGVALRREPRALDLRRRCCERLLATRALVIERTPGHDGTIPSWGWVPDTASWVEPTAYAILSLVATGFGDHPRVAEGRRMLLDRQCADGGWNYGNPVVLGTVMESYPGPTAWAVMALPPGEAVDRGLARLDRAVDEPSTAALALVVLARTAHGRPPGPALEHLLARQRPDGGFGDRIDRTALAACALEAGETGDHAFRV